MPTGTVKWFNPTKGYGFIQTSGGGGKDVFVHISAVERAGLRSLNEGQTIEYEIESDRGRQSRPILGSGSGISASSVADAGGRAVSAGCQPSRLVAREQFGR